MIYLSPIPWFALIFPAARRARVRWLPAFRITLRSAGTIAFNQSQCPDPEVSGHRKQQLKRNRSGTATKTASGMIPIPANPIARRKRSSPKTPNSLSVTRRDRSYFWNAWVSVPTMPVLREE